MAQDREGWVPFDATEFADAKAVVGFGVIMGWTTNDDDPSTPPSINNNAAPLLTLAVDYFTNEQFSTFAVDGDYVMVPDGTVPENEKFAMRLPVVADLIAALLASGMRVDSGFANMVLQRLVAQAIDHVDEQIVGLIGEGGDS